MRLPKRISNLNPSIVFLFLAVLIGGYIRLSQVLGAPLPLGDGGMFYSMTQDLINNQFRLPELLTYNHLNLPNSYPPLGFYLAGLVSWIFGIELIDVVRVLPSVFTVLAIPAFFLFARNFITNELQLIIATLMFAFLPPTFDWLILGGGITRAPAFFFSILALHFIYRLFTESQIKNIIFSSLFSALTLLTHPQVVLFTAASALVFFAFLERNRSGLKKSIIVALFTLILTAPWWGTVIARTGAEPFLAAVSTGGYNLDALIGFFKLDLTKEIGLETVGVLGLIGLFWYISEKRCFLPVWFFVTFIIDPRSGPRNLALLYPVFASYSLVNLFSLFTHSGKDSRAKNSDIYSGRFPKVVLLLLIGQWIFSAFSTALIVKETFSLSEEDKIAAKWIQENTNPESNFLVLTGLEPLSDPFSEWLPALTNRVSIATTQGKEWDTKSDFDDVLLLYWQTQNCINKEFNCFDDLKSKNQLFIDYDYILLRSQDIESRINLESYVPALVNQLVSSDDMTLIYSTKNVYVIQKTLNFPDN